MVGIYPYFPWNITMMFDYNISIFPHRSQLPHQCGHHGHNLPHLVPEALNGLGLKPGVPSKNGRLQWEFYPSMARIVLIRNDSCIEWWD